MTDSTIQRTGHMMKGSYWPHFVIALAAFALGLAFGIPSGRALERDCLNPTEHGVVRPECG